MSDRPARIRSGGRSARRSLRNAPDFEMLKGLKNALPFCEVMDCAQVEQIDAASMDILENIGVVFRVNNFVVLVRSFGDIFGHLVIRQSIKGHRNPRMVN